MTKANKINIGTGIGFFVYGVLFLTGSLSFAAPGRSGDYGPGFFPILVGCLIIFFSMALLFTTWWGIRKKMAEQKPAEVFPPDYKSILYSVVILIAYMAALQPVGFIVSSSLYSTLQMKIMSSKKTSLKQISFYAFISIVMSAGIYYIFVKFFSLMLPAGIFG